MRYGQKMVIVMHNDCTSNSWIVARLWCVQSFGGWLKLLLDNNKIFYQRENKIQ